MGGRGNRGAVAALFVGLVGGVSLLGGCAQSKSVMVPGPYVIDDRDYGGSVYAEDALMPSPPPPPSEAGEPIPQVAGVVGSAKRSRKAEAVGEDDSFEVVLAESQVESEEPPASEPPKARMVHYSGHASLLVTKPEETADDVVALAEEAGGFVEVLRSDLVTVRVPVAVFDTTFAAILDIGEVQSRSVSASDVTESFHAVSLRLATARKTRDRLLELLERAEEEESKIALLAQIQRVTEQIDLAEAQARTLASLAAMSRIHVQLSPRRAFEDVDVTEEIAGFEWIRGLSPFSGDVALWGGKLVLDVPQGMVRLDVKGAFVAESPDGSVLRSGKLRNEPAGDAQLWIDAVQLRLGPQFEEAEVSRIGGFQVLRMVGVDDGYRYLVALRTVGRKLHLVEAYFPSAEHEERMSEAVLAVLESAGEAQS